MECLSELSRKIREKEKKFEGGNRTRIKGTNRGSLKALLGKIWGILKSVFNLEPSPCMKAFFLAVRTGTFIYPQMYLSGFAKTWLKKFQVHFHNLTSKSNEN